MGNCTISGSSTSVVVIGAGLAGLTLAREAEKFGMQVIILEKNDRFFHSAASCRAVVDSQEGAEKRIFIPYTRALKNAGSSIMQGTAEAVDYEARAVQYKDASGEKRILRYRYLVLTPGSLGTFPISSTSLNHIEG